MVAPGFFDALGMQIVAGRDFNAGDTENSPAVGIVSEAFARELFGDVNAVGRTFEFRRSSVEIVGVASDTTFNAAREGSRRMFYIPYTQQADRLFSLCVIVRAATDSSALTASVRDEIRSVDPALPVTKIDSLAQQLDQSLLVERVAAASSTAFAVLAALLACIGVYGVVAFGVARRTKEIGIRMALGATRAGVTTMILRRIALVAIGGIMAGIPLAMGATAFSATMLFGVQPDDPWVLGGSVGLMLLVTVVAGLLPARGAANVEPVIALRHE